MTTTSLEGAVRDAAATARPAVVQITTEQISVDQFSRPYATPTGVGSGVIFDDAGHILTNNHVVEGAQQLRVLLPDGRSFDATLVGADAETDLAVIQIEGSDLPVATLGKSADLVVGDWVVAIGNALGLTGGPTVTAGVVSALDRTVQEPGEGAAAGPFLYDMIQTDASINPGNSGGALIDLQGNVVGINTLVAGTSSSGVTAQGIGFAIAIDRARPIADTLVQNGHVVHPYLGVSYLPLNPAISAQLNLRPTSGAVVGAVASGGPAAQGGVQVGDVIAAIDGETLERDSDLSRIIDEHAPGDTITLTIERNDSELMLDVTLSEKPS